MTRAHPAVEAVRQQPGEEQAGRARLPRAARDADLAARFWTAAEELTGVSLPAGSARGDLSVG